MLCPACHSENPRANRFCGACGHLLTGAADAVPDTSRVAPGVPVDSRATAPRSYTPRHLAEKILTSQSALEGERKQVTVMFCDITNSTALAERVGPDAMHSLLNGFFETALNEVHRYEGTINQFLGDGFMALFGAPTACEDHARRALLAALAIQRALVARHDAAAAAGEPHVQARMGVNTGLVVVGAIGDNLRMDYTGVGDTTNLAARLQGLAEPGTIYVSEHTRRAVEDHFDLDPLGARTVKGKAEPVSVYKVLGARKPHAPTPGRHSRSISSPVVGRDAEVAALTDRVERLASGQGGIVAVIGDAGVGKSRLLAEARKQAADERLLWLEGRSLSFGHAISYWPVLEIIKGCIGITEEDEEGESWAKLEARVRTLFPEVDEVLPYIATLLGLEVREEWAKRVKYLDSGAMGRQILLTSRRFFERLAKERPLVLVFEDVHWADQSSAELLQHLLPLVETVPLLICGISRPDPGSPAARLREVGRRYAERYTEIVLAPLSPADSASLLCNCLESDELPPRVRELILGKAEGNPFFMEEVMHALIDVGALVWDNRTDAWRATGKIDQITVPDTIQGVIMARVDRLDEAVKDALKMASVIGRSFIYRVLKAIAAAEQELDQHLAELTQVELIREKSLAPELEYIFKHALTQEATYESILLRRRRELHRRVGECIEALFETRLEEFYGFLAYHYARAEDWEKAQHYLFKAGDQAGKVAADTEALAHYREAAAAYARVFGERWDPLQRAMLDRKIGEALFRRGEHQQALEYLHRALAALGNPHPVSRWGVRRALLRELLRQVVHRVLGRWLLPPLEWDGDAYAEERARLYTVLSWIDYPTDVERFVLDGLLQLNSSERAGFPAGTAQGATAVGLTCDFVPLFRLAERYHRRAVTLAEQTQNPVARGIAYFGFALHHHCLGEWSSEIELCERAAAACQEAGDIHGAGGASTMTSWALAMQGELARSLAQSQHTSRLAQDGGDHQVLGWAELGLGQGLWRTGETDEAVAHLQEAIALLKAVPDYHSLATALGALGHCRVRQGKLLQALTVLQECEQLINARSLRGFLCTEFHRCLAEAHLAAAEQVEGGDRVKALKTARRACRAALQQTRFDRGSAPVAYRLQGTRHWLQGNGRAAQKWWRRSVALAEEQGARYELGITYLEMGERTMEPALLQKGEALLAETGMKIDLNRARRLRETEKRKRSTVE